MVTIYHAFEGRVKIRLIEIGRDRRSSDAFETKIRKSTNVASKVCSPNFFPRFERIYLLLVITEKSIEFLL